MEGDVEKKFNSNFFGREENRSPGPKGCEEDSEECQPEGDMDQSVGELKKEYPEEFKKITELAKKAGFEEIEITQEKGKDVSSKNPNRVFLPKIYLDNYREAVKYIKEDDIDSGLLFKLFDLKNYLKQPEKREILYKISAKEYELEGLKKEIRKAANENKNIEKTSEVVNIKKEIKNLDKLLHHDFRKKLSEPEIEKLSLRYNIMGILDSGIENSFAVKAAELKKLKDENKISLADYNQQLSDRVFPEISDIHEIHPFLDEESRNKLRKKSFEIAEKLGEIFLKKKVKEKKEGEGKNKYDFGIYG